MTPPSVVTTIVRGRFAPFGAYDQEATMYARKLLWGVPVFGAAGLGFYMDRLADAVDAKKDVKPAVTLPVTRVVLFNSGVGYFTRGGEVEGEARVDLTFPEEDVNDLLKRMV